MPFGPLDKLTDAIKKAPWEAPAKAAGDAVRRSGQSLGKRKRGISRDIRGIGKAAKKKTGDMDRALFEGDGLRANLKKIKKEVK